MPIARFKMPDGRVAKFEIPDGLDPQQAEELINADFGGMFDGSQQPEPVVPETAPVAPVAPVPEQTIPEQPPAGMPSQAPAQEPQTPGIINSQRTAANPSEPMSMSNMLGMPPSISDSVQRGNEAQDRINATANGIDVQSAINPPSGAEQEGGSDDVIRRGLQDTFGPDVGEQAFNDMQALYPKELPEATIGESVSALGTFFSGAPGSTKAAYAYSTGKNFDPFNVPKAITDFEEEMLRIWAAAPEDKHVVRGITLNDIIDAINSIGVSALSSGAGLVAGVATSPAALLPVPGARYAPWAAGMFASGAAAYNMSIGMFKHEVFKAYNAESIEKNKRPISPEEWDKRWADIDSLATKHGLYEAIPEALSNLGLGAVVFKPMKKLLGKSIITRLPAKWAAIMGTELATETITQTGQTQTGYEAGLPGYEDRKWDAEGTKKSFDEIYGQTAVLTSIMLGIGGVAGGTAVTAREGYKTAQGQGAPFTKERAVSNAINAASPGAANPEDVTASPHDVINTYLRGDAAKGEAAPPPGAPPVVPPIVAPPPPDPTTPEGAAEAADQAQRDAEAAAARAAQSTPPTAPPAPETPLAAPEAATTGKDITDQQPTTFETASGVVATSIERGRKDKSTGRRISSGKKYIIVDNLTDTDEVNGESLKVKIGFDENGSLDYFLNYRDDDASAPVKKDLAAEGGYRPYNENEIDEFLAAINLAQGEAVRQPDPRVHIPPVDPPTQTMIDRALQNNGLTSLDEVDEIGRERVMEDAIRLQEQEMLVSDENTTLTQLENLRLEMRRLRGAEGTAQAETGRARPAYKEGGTVQLGLKGGQGAAFAQTEEPSLAATENAEIVKIGEGKIKVRFTADEPAFGIKAGDTAVINSRTGELMTAFGTGAAAASRTGAIVGFEQRNNRRPSGTGSVMLSQRTRKNIEEDLYEMSVGDPLDVMMADAADQVDAGEISLADAAKEVASNFSGRYEPDDIAYGLTNYYGVKKQNMSRLEEEVLYDEYMTKIDKGEVTINMAAAEMAEKSGMDKQSHLEDLMYAYGLEDIPGFSDDSRDTRTQDMFDRDGHASDLPEMGYESHDETIARWEREDKETEERLSKEDDAWWDDYNAGTSGVVQSTSKSRPINLDSWVSKPVRRNPNTAPYWALDNHLADNATGEVDKGSRRALTPDLVEAFDNPPVIDDPSLRQPLTAKEANIISQVLRTMILEGYPRNVIRSINGYVLQTEQRYVHVQAAYDGKHHEIRFSKDTLEDIVDNKDSHATRKAMRFLLAHEMTHAVESDKNERTVSMISPLFHLSMDSFEFTEVEHEYFVNEYPPSKKGAKPARKGGKHQQNKHWQARHGRNVYSIESARVKPKKVRHVYKSHTIHFNVKAGGEVIGEMINAYENVKDFRGILSYPFSSLGSLPNMKEDMRQAEIDRIRAEAFAQLGALVHTYPELAAKHLPKGYKLMQEVFRDANHTDRGARRRSLRGTLQVEGAGRSNQDTGTRLSARPPSSRGKRAADQGAGQNSRKRRDTVGIFTIANMQPEGASDYYTDDYWFALEDVLEEQGEAIFDVRLNNPGRDDLGIPRPPWQNLAYVHFLANKLMLERNPDATTLTEEGQQLEKLSKATRSGPMLSQLTLGGNGGRGAKLIAAQEKKAKEKAAREAADAALPPELRRKYTGDPNAVFIHDDYTDKDGSWGTLPEFNGKGITVAPARVISRIGYWVDDDRANKRHLKGLRHALYDSHMLMGGNESFVWDSPTDALDAIARVIHNFNDARISKDGKRLVLSQGIQSLGPGRGIHVVLELNMEPEGSQWSLVTAYEGSYDSVKKLQPILLEAAGQSSGGPSSIATDRSGQESRESRRTPAANEPRLSQSQRVGKGVFSNTKEEVKAIADAVMAGMYGRPSWKGGPMMVMVLQSFEELRLTNPVLYDLVVAEANDTSTVAGFYDDTMGNVFLIADAMVNESHVIETLLHETRGHFALRTFFNDSKRGGRGEFIAFLEQTYELFKDDPRMVEYVAWAKKGGLNVKTKSGRIKAAEEFLAERAGDEYWKHTNEAIDPRTGKPHVELQNTLDKLIGYFMEWLRNLAKKHPVLKPLVKNYSKRDIMHILAMAGERYVDKNPPVTSTGKRQMPVRLSQKRLKESVVGTIDLPETGQYLTPTQRTRVFYSQLHARALAEAPLEGTPEQIRAWIKIATKKGDTLEFNPDSTIEALEKIKAEMLANVFESESAGVEIPASQFEVTKKQVAAAIKANKVKGYVQNNMPATMPINEAIEYVRNLRHVFGGGMVKTDEVQLLGVNEFLDAFAEDEKITRAEFAAWLHANEFLVYDVYASSRFFKTVYSKQGIEGKTIDVVTPAPIHFMEDGHIGSVDAALAEELANAYYEENIEDYLDNAEREARASTVASRTAEGRRNRELAESWMEVFSRIDMREAIEDIKNEIRALKDLEEDEDGDTLSTEDSIRIDGYSVIDSDGDVAVGASGIFEIDETTGRFLTRGTYLSLNDVTEFLDEIDSYTGNFDGYDGIGDLDDYNVGRFVRGYAQVASLVLFLRKEAGIGFYQSTDDLVDAVLLPWMDNGFGESFSVENFEEQTTNPPEALEERVALAKAQAASSLRETAQHHGRMQAEERRPVKYRESMVGYSLIVHHESNPQHIAIYNEEDALVEDIYAELGQWMENLISHARVIADADIRMRGKMVYETTHETNEAILERPSKWDTYAVSGKNYRSILITMPYESPEGPFIYTTHWGQDQNIMVYVRLSDVTWRDDNQNEHHSLMIEELQSDWYQIGTLIGFDNAANLEEMSRLQDELDGLKELQREARGLAPQEETEKITVDDDQLNDILSQIGSDSIDSDGEVSTGRGYLRLDPYSNGHGSFTDAVEYYGRDGALKRVAILLRRAANGLGDFTWLDLSPIGSNEEVIQWADDFLGEGDNETPAVETEYDYKIKMLEEKIDALYDSAPSLMKFFTKTYMKIAMKRIARIAVDEGYDAIVVAPGAVHTTSNPYRDVWGTDAYMWTKSDAAVAARREVTLRELKTGLIRKNGEVEETKKEYRKSMATISGAYAEYLNSKQEGPEHTHALTKEAVKKAIAQRRSIYMKKMAELRKSIRSSINAINKLESEEASGELPDGVYNIMEYGKFSGAIPEEMMKRLKDQYYAPDEELRNEIQGYLAERFVKYDFNKQADLIRFYENTKNALQWGVHGYGRHDSLGVHTAVDYVPKLLKMISDNPSGGARFRRGAGLSTFYDRALLGKGEGLKMLGKDFRVGELGGDHYRLDDDVAGVVVDANFKKKWGVEGGGTPMLSGRRRSRRILAKVGKQTAAQRAIASATKPGFLKSIANWFIRKTLDSGIPFKRMVEQAAGTVPTTEDPYYAWRILAGDSAMIEDWLGLNKGTEGTVPFDTRDKLDGLWGKSMRQILEPVMQDAETLKDFEEYIIARRAGELIEAGKERLFTMEDIEYGLRFKSPLFDQVADELYRYNDQLIKYAVDGGFLSEEVAVKLRKYSYYIPFFRESEYEGDVGGSAPKGIFKRLTGGKQHIRDPLQNMMDNTANIIHSVNRNAAVLKALYLAESRPDGGQWMARVPIPKSAIKLTTDRIIEQLIKEGVDIDRASADEISYMQTFFQNKPVGDEKTRTIILKENGQAIAVKILNESLWDTLHAMAPMDFGLLTDLLAVPAETVRTGIVMDGGFMAANFARDTISGFIQSRKGKSSYPVLDSTLGMYDAVTGAEIYKLYRAMGAAHADFWHGDSKEAHASLKRLAKVGNFRPGTVLNPATYWRLLRKIGTVTETGTRLKAFKRQLDLDPDDPGNALIAALEAREISVDFGMHGASRTLRVLERITPFLNPAKQGLYKGGRVIADQPITTLLRGSPIVALTLYLWLLNKDEDWYKDIEDWEKNHYWHADIGIRTSTEDEKDIVVPLRIPKPFEWGAIFGSFQEALFQYLDDRHGKEAMERVGSTIEDVFMLRGYPPSLTLPVELWANESTFSERPVVSPYLEGVRPEYQVGPGTSSLSREVGKVAGMSPIKLDHAIRSVFGTLGVYALMATNSPIDKITGTAPRAERHWWQMPVVKRFFSDPFRSSSKSVTEFYDTLNEMKIDQRTWKFLDYSDEFEASLGNDDMFEAGVLQAYANAISAIRKDSRSIRFDKDIPAKKKMEQIDRNVRDMRSLARDAVEDSPKARRLREMDALRQAK